MEARELRLGNKVLCKWIEEEWSDDANDYIDVEKEKFGTVVQLDSTGTLNHSIIVETKNEDGVYVEDFESIQGVPLTEDWILRFGFNETEEGFFANGTRLTLAHNKEVYDGYIVCWDETTVRYIHYVNQLQNAYYFITGQELTLKQE